MRLAQMSGPEKVTKMLDVFRAYRRREFKPNPKALRILVEMGFTESDALDALCIHGNKQEEAVSLVWKLCLMCVKSGVFMIII